MPQIRFLSGLCRQFQIIIQSNLQRVLLRKTVSRGKKSENATVIDKNPNVHTAQLKEEYINCALSFLFFQYYVCEKYI